MGFEDATDVDFKNAFMAIITRGSFNNTYKFALARFLLDYCNSSDSPSVRYSEIARCFFRYYWLQECKSRLRQGPQNQTPEVITIIRGEFQEAAYPQSFEELEKSDSAGIRRCIDMITRRCFDDVIHRFQKHGRTERRLFYDYRAKRYNDSSDNARIDPGGGILLNENAMHFLRDNYVPLYKSVILEWMRFLEKRNFGMPNMVRKIEGMPGPRDQARFCSILAPSATECFYCDNLLEPGRRTHVDHVLPYDYIGDTELWNLVLACQGCNSYKSDRLPPRRYVYDLIKRNDTFRERIPALDKSVSLLDHGSQNINWHYDNAVSHGYPQLERFPVPDAA